MGARGGNGGIDTARHGRKNSHAAKPIRRGGGRGGRGGRGGGRR
jgi:hypothetical protein